MTNNVSLCTLADSVHRILDKAYPGELGFLKYRTAYELVISVILSAQTTDNQVNRVTGALFERFPGSKDLAGANQEDVEEIIRSTGYFRAKARNIIGAARTINTKFNDRVPGTMRDLLQIPGIGRKSANVVLGAAFGQPAIIVDTHFGRVVRRIGLTDEAKPERIESDIRELIKPEQQYRFSMTVNNHGRVVCHARKPECNGCSIATLCMQKYL